MKIYIKSGSSYKYPLTPDYVYKLKVDKSYMNNIIIGLRSYTKDGVPLDYWELSNEKGCLIINGEQSLNKNIEKDIPKIYTQREPSFVTISPVDADISIDQISNTWNNSNFDILDADYLIKSLLY